MRPALAIGRFANRVFERVVVDGLVTGTQETVRGGGGVVRAVQNGFVRSYALLLIAGFAGLALYFLLGRADDQLPALDPAGLRHRRPLPAEAGEPAGGRRWARW